MRTGEDCDFSMFFKTTMEKLKGTFVFFFSSILVVGTQLRIFVFKHLTVRYIVHIVYSLTEPVVSQLSAGGYVQVFLFKNMSVYVQVFPFIRGCQYIYKYFHIYEDGGGCDLLPANFHCS